MVRNRCLGWWPLVLVLLTAPFSHALESPSYGRYPAFLDSLKIWHTAAAIVYVDSVTTAGMAESRARGDSLTWRWLTLARGRAFASHGMAKRAVPDLQDALALGEAGADTQVQLRSLRWLNLSLIHQGRSADADSTNARLEALARAARDSLHLGYAWLGQAYTHYQAGEPIAAGEIYAAAGQALEAGGDLSGAIWARNGQGMADQQAGRFDEAMAAYRQVLQHARAVGDELNEAMALNFMGRLELRVGDPGQAEIMLEQSADIHQRGRRHREGAVPRIDMATARVLQGRVEAATALLDTVLADCREQGFRDLEILATTKLLDVYLDEGRPGLAASICRQTMAHKPWPSVMAGTELRLRLARSLADRDSLAAALEVLDDAAADGYGEAELELAVEAERGRLLLALDQPGEALSSVVAVQAKVRFSGGDNLRIPLLTVKGRAWMAQGSLDSALVAFDEAVALWEADRELPADPSWREQRSHDASELFAYVVSARMANGDTAAAYAHLQSYKARTLLERMMGPRPNELSAPQSPDLTTLRRWVLHDDEVLLDLVQGPEHGVMFVVARDTLLVATVPGRQVTAPLRQRLVDVLAIAELVDDGPAVSLATRMMGDFPPPVAQRLARAGRVIWCPDGDYHRLPLVLLCGQDLVFSEDCQVSRIPSAGILSVVRGRHPAASPSTTILAVHGPDLPGAAAETRWLAAHLHDVLRLESLDAASWTDANVVHLAAHVDLDSRQPWQTSIRLGTEPDDHFTAGAAAATSMNGSLAVLSGCRTAGSRLVDGEGMLGLASGFLVAGMPAVVATLWEVDDRVAALFMADFYAALAHGVPTVEALSQARQLSRSRSDSRAPRHWAAFILLGDGSRSVDVRKRRHLWPIALVLLTLAGALVVMARWQQQGLDRNHQ